MRTCFRGLAAVGLVLFAAPLCAKTALPPADKMPAEKLEAPATAPPPADPKVSPRAQGDELIGRQVLDPSGAMIGQVRGVLLGGTGELTHVIVAVGARDVALPVSEIRMAANDSRLRTYKSAQEIEKIPPTESGPPPYPHQPAGQ